MKNKKEYRLCNGYYVDAYNGDLVRFEDAKFHRWGDNYIELGDTYLQVTVGIVELQSGVIVKCDPTDICFKRND